MKKKLLTKILHQLKYKIRKILVGLKVGIKVALLVVLPVSGGSVLARTNTNTSIVAENKNISSKYSDDIIARERNSAHNKAVLQQREVILKQKEKKLQFEKQQEIFFLEYIRPKILAKSSTILVNELQINYSIIPKGSLQSIVEKPLNRDVLTDLMIKLHVNAEKSNKRVISMVDFFHESEKKIAIQKQIEKQIVQDFQFQKQLKILALRGGQKLLFLALLSKIEALLAKIEDVKKFLKLLNYKINLKSKGYKKIKFNQNERIFLFFLVILVMYSFYKVASILLKNNTILMYFARTNTFGKWFESFFPQETSHLVDLIFSNVTDNEFIEVFKETYSEVDNLEEFACFYVLFQIGVIHNRVAKKFLTMDQVRINTNLLPLEVLNFQKEFRQIPVRKFVTMLASLDWKTLKNLPLKDSCKKIGEFYFHNIFLNKN